MLGERATWRRLLPALAQIGAVRRTLGDLNGAHQEGAALPLPGFPPFQELVAGELCADAVAEGDWQRAAQHARDAPAHRLDDVLFAGLTRPDESEALRRFGERDLVAEDLAKLGERVTGRPRFRLAFLRSFALLQAERGETEGAVAALEEARGFAASMQLLGKS